MGKKVIDPTEGAVFQLSETLRKSNNKETLPRCLSKKYTQPCSKKINHAVPRTFGFFDQ